MKFEKSRLLLIIFLPIILSFGIISIVSIPAFSQTIQEKEPFIPNWVKNNARWWANGLISDSDFVKGLEFLIKQKIITIPLGMESKIISETQIPAWFQKQASWWAEGLFSDEEFINAIQYLVTINVISLDTSVESSKVIQTIPATSKTIVNFYVNDQDLNTSPNGIDEVSTDGLIEVTINGVKVDVPSTMIETTPSSGQFFLRINLPETIDGKPLQQDDVVLVKYLDEADHAGETRIITSSFPLSKTFANLQSAGGGQRIGHEFTLRIYEPDANIDSKDEDKISLSALEFRAEGGIRTTLANPLFSANSAFLIETGPNSNVFEVKIKIPRTVDGKTIHIGDWYEVRYLDKSTPSETIEKVILKGRIG